MNIQPSIRSAGKVAFAAGFLLAVFLFLALLWAQYQGRYIGVSNSHATGLASVAGFDNPIALWNSTNLLDVLFPGNFSRRARAYSMYLEPDDESRKLVKSGNLQIEAPQPATAAEQIHEIAKQFGGDVLKSALNNNFADKPEIALQISVPASHFDEAMAQIKDLGYRFDSEQIEVRDVGKEYVDLDATIRNEEAKEAQYLSILKKATTVHDTLEVSQHLNEVRGNIEKTKGELQYLARQIAMSALDITITGKNRIGQLDLHPLYRMRLAWQNTVSSIADFASGMLMLISYLPAILLWGITLFVLAAFAWRILRWLWKVLGFVRPSAA